MLNDFMTSQIRTWVPVIVGAVLTLIARETHLVVDEATSAQVIAWLSSLLAGLWYLVARLLETRWPAFGWMIGVPRQPTYAEPPPTT